MESEKIAVTSHTRPSAQPVRRGSFDVAPRPHAARQMDVARPQRPMGTAAPSHAQAVAQAAPATPAPVQTPRPIPQSPFGSQPGNHPTAERPIFSSAPTHKGKKRKSNKKIRVLVIILIILVALVAWGVVWAVGQFMDTKTVIT